MARMCVADDPCSETKIIARGLCDCHYRMWRIYGRTYRVTRYQGEGSVTSDGYHVTSVNGKQRMTHILLAEKALGKPLPPEAIVHHVTEDKQDNYGPFKLVICPNQTYHAMIHKLMREKGISFRADGKPSVGVGRPKNNPTL